jgi:heterodisulfide reductase subunit C
MKVKRAIKYESELDHDFADWITTIPGGEKVRGCIQCGTCSGICPVSVYMDYTPRRIIGMTRAGFKKEVLESATTWLCASCYACMVECPAGIKITEIMYALKRRAIEEKVYPKRLPIPVLAREFVRMIKKRGRNAEMYLLANTILRTNPFKMLSQAPLGLKLLKAGRAEIISESMKNPKEIRTMFKALEG